ncbi:MAG: tRNA (adenosine(37)-N6)-threonylcarbamoyltransferase complex ATPase subunit type 1 TsaE [Phycisphaerae bacterium]|nr:tRNA (adenosine(37)-N6)-threonylcarbamoyltransferase complex ATPase subunit type 1 TsaE [Phycisphaerae bacterium]
MSEWMRQIELVTDSPEQTRRLGERLARCLTGGHVVALVGHLGAGKTQWVKGLAAGLGIDPDAVHSPTFTIINEYTPKSGLLLYHVDVYRLGSAAELEAIGFSEMVAAADGLVAIEWADRVAELMPPGSVWITGSMPSNLGENQRQYAITSDRPDVIDALQAQD